MEAGEGLRQPPADAFQTHLAVLLTLSSNQKSSEEESLAGKCDLFLVSFPSRVSLIFANPSPL